MADLLLSYHSTAEQESIEVHIRSGSVPFLLRAASWIFIALFKIAASHLPWNTSLASQLCSAEMFPMANPRLAGWPPHTLKPT
jgi:hypothetical protein